MACDPSLSLRLNTPFSLAGECWLVTTFVSEIFSFKTMPRAHVSMGVHTYRSCIAALWLRRRAQRALSLDWVYEAAPRLRASARRPAHALSHWAAIRSVTRIVEFPVDRALFCHLLTGSFDPWCPAKGVQITFLVPRSRSLAGCSDASFKVAWGAFMEKPEEAQLAVGTGGNLCCLAGPVALRPCGRGLTIRCALPAEAKTWGGASLPRGPEKHGRVCVCWEPICMGTAAKNVRSLT